MATRPLSELKPRDRGSIAKVGGGGAIRRRMLDMGLVVGSEIEVERVAPLGDPIELKVKGYHLSLRKEEAADIQVEILRDGERIVPLSTATPGKPVRVLSIRGGWGLARRVHDLGLTPGSNIVVLDSQPRGRMIVESKGARIPLGRGMAQKILVMESS